MTVKEMIGWGLFMMGSLLGIDVAWTSGGALAAQGALSTTLLTAAAVLGIQGRSNTTPRQ